MGYEEFIEIDKERFMTTLKQKNSSIRKLGAIQDIDRCEKTLRTYLNIGSIPYKVLDRIGQYLNVEPLFLAGKYDRNFEKLENPKLIAQYKNTLTPENYPYIKSLQSSIGFEQHFKDILTMSGINWEQFQSLTSTQRITLRQELNVAIQSVISNYFNTDSFGNNTKDVLAYFENIVGDFSPEDLEYEGEKIDWPHWLKKSK